MTPPRTHIHDLVMSREFEPMKPMDILRELRILVQHLELSNCIFRTNHASNYLPMRGVLNEDKDAILEILDETISKEDTSSLRSGYLRGL